ncbi:MAG: dioxygenase [Acidaminobacter sp.]|uniref:DODA-type extradiol aromatic ring-opening family dioxygenase n=1 Tax=Acidaminobacter sp. TaxID=1872102 RepID=UPI00137DBB96|nr:class III extradiol ring-cleavage dioxygenase [Acidaminobacter sp.]MZQ99669.1 dioxygenase [Acidaminobacter sp.]
MIPSIFVCHGGPNLILLDNDYTQSLRALGKRYQPKAIVIFTAHWESPTLSISSTDDTYNMIYDFGGFQKELYSFNYPAKGSTKVAALLQNSLANHGISSRLNTERGLDHGSWDVLALMYPEANIPVVQVSIHPKLSYEEQYKIGSAIQELKQEDIMIIGSGSTVHNLGTLDWNSNETQGWAVEFDDWLLEHLEKQDLDSLFKFESLAPHSKLAIPRNEHIVPLFIAMGSGQKNAAPKLLHRSYDYGTLSYISIEF